jgi:V8-like Glu-specific endopeptidase
MPQTNRSQDFGLFPPLPEELAAADAALREGRVADRYAAILETQCGATDDSQPVEQYDGTLGVSQGFVAEHQAPVGQLQWNANLGTIYDSPGNVSGVRWCTGVLISENLFLGAGHCFDQTGGGWQRPRVNGTNDIIPVDEIARNMHVNFNFQDDPDGEPRQEVEFAVEALLEYRLGGLDFAVVRLAGRPGQQFGVGRIASQDAAVNDMLAIIGHPAGVPKRIEAGPLTSFDGDRLRYNDIDTLGGNSGSAIWHSPSGLVVGVHTNGGCTTGGSGSNSGVRVARILEESPIVSAVQLATLPAPLRGRHTIRQVSSGRFVDAHESAAEDFRLVTRPAQNNDTQRWLFTPVGGVFTMQQASNGRFVDAHEHAGEDFRLVTRTAQHNDTQRWVFLSDPDRLATCTIQQLSNGRFVDAHEHSGEDFRLVTRTRQNNDSQRWVVIDVGNGRLRIQQRSSRRFMDAHEHGGQDFRLVTRARQENDTQLWTLELIGRVYAIQQLSSGRFIDAHEHGGEDFRLVTRTAQLNDTQLWVVLHRGNGEHTIQQLSNGRLVDAHEHDGEDFRLVTRPAQNNDTQRWLITSV